MNRFPEWVKQKAKHWWRPYIFPILLGLVLSTAVWGLIRSAIERPPRADARIVSLESANPSHAGQQSAIATLDCVFVPKNERLWIVIRSSDGNYPVQKLGNCLRNLTIPLCIGAAEERGSFSVALYSVDFSSNETMQAAADRAEFPTVRP